jgi:UDP-N-acetylmuramate: L-alanyl-gamma-D-glutamyl-meso-diaminopimelate ligase
LPYQSQAETVKREFLRGKRVLVLAGTHGKTTTTSIAAHLLEVGGLNPGFLVGGVVQNFGASFHVTDSDYFTIEGDEYDTAYFDKGPKFMHYLPEIAIVSNIEFDHADIYADLAAVKLAFRRLMNLVPGNGRLLINGDDPNIRDVLAEMKGRLHTQVETFGTGEENLWQACDMNFSGEMTRFRVFREGTEWGEFETPLIGEFNVRNCLACIIAADAWGVRPEQSAEALRTFKSVQRRMQVRGEERGVTVIDDFAHHPTAVRETLRALRAKYGDERRLIAVFEPRSWSSRLAVFQDDYAQAFQSADEVILAAVFKSSSAAELGRVLNTDELVRDIERSGTPAAIVDGADEIVRRLAPVLRAGDVVAIMSNGGFDRIHDKLLDELRIKN